MGKLVSCTVMVSALLCTLCTGISSATIINFDDLEIPGSYFTYVDSYSNSGFTITSSYTQFPKFLSSQQQEAWYFGSANLFNDYGYEWTTIASSSGAFSIDSIDVHGLTIGGVPLDFYAYSGSVQVGYLKYVIPDNNWHTVNFDSSFENIDSLKWQQVYPYHTFDNIVLNGTSAVPEPATIVLFGIGSGAMVLLRRKKKIL